MKQRTLTETLMGEEAIGEYQTTLYDKTATAYMFGYANSGFGSPIGGNGSGFSGGNKGNIRRDLGSGLQERYDWSGHNGLNPHLNIDIIGTSINIGPSHHIDLDFGLGKKKW